MLSARGWELPPLLDKAASNWNNISMMNCEPWYGYFYVYDRFQVLHHKKASGWTRSHLKESHRLSRHQHLNSSMGLRFIVYEDNRHN